MKESATPLNIRYLGYESLSNGGRRLEYSLTSQGEASRRVTLEIPGDVFVGANRISIQESAPTCYQKLRHEIHEGRIPPAFLTLTPEDIARFRPRRRAAAKKA